MPPNIELVDAHCHIDLLKDPASEVKNAEAARIHTIAVTNAPSVFFHTRNLCQEKQFVHAALGLHPELVHSHGDEVKKFQEQIEQTKFVGEIGLDYVTNDQSLRNQQREVFEAILRCCSDAGGRILTIHSRRSASDVIAALSATSKNIPILHWFSGSKRELDRANAIGSYFSVNPSMLSSKTGLTLLAGMPRDHVLTETDGPFVRLRGQACGPGDTISAARQLAAAWGTPFEEAVAMVSHNFARVLAVARAWPET
jgi:TatD DNase family protein